MNSVHAGTVFFSMLLFLLLLTGCGGTSETVSVIPPKEPAWSQDEFNALREKWSEIEGDKEMADLSDQDISLVKELFFLSVDGRNREVDYGESYRYAHILMRNSSESSTSFHSWVLVLTQLSEMSHRVDSLNTALENSTDENGIYQDSINVLTNTLQTKNSEITQLQEQVNSQTEVIEKLKKLELLMEQERKRFQ